MLVALTDARLVVREREEATGVETVQLANEDLIRWWGSLREWINEDRTFLLWRQQLQTDIADWERLGRDFRLLPQGPLLDEARINLGAYWNDLSDPERRYIQEADARDSEINRLASRQRVRWRVTLATVVLALAVAVVIAAVALWPSAQASVASAEVSPTQATIVEGERRLLVAEVYDEGGNLLTDRDVFWATSDFEIADVELFTGVVTGKAPGSATIIASSEGVDAAKVVITVITQPVASISLSPEAATIVEGDVIQITAVPNNAAGDPPAGRTVKWVSTDSKIADVDSTGLVTGIASGIATIIVTSEESSRVAVITVESLLEATPTPIPTATTIPTPTTAAVPPPLDPNYATVDALLQNPGYDPTWGTPKYGGIARIRTASQTSNCPWCNSVNSHMAVQPQYNVLIRNDPWQGFGGGNSPRFGRELGDLRRRPHLHIPSEERCALPRLHTTR